jgi:hypothetical protein
MATITPVPPAGFYPPLPVYRRPEARASAFTVDNTTNRLAVDDRVDLSPLARQLTDSDNVGATLTRAQEKAIEEIFASHQDEPRNRDTVNRIFAELTPVGISPQQLVLLNYLLFFDPFSPLFGTGGSSDFFSNTLSNPLVDFAFINEQSKITAYLLQVFLRFYNISFIR